MFWRFCLQYLLPVAAFLVLPGWAAASTPEAGRPGRQLTCYNDRLVPYFMREGGQFVGINADLMREAARRVGITLVFRDMPWKRLEAEIAKGAHSQVDCAFAFSRTPAREKYMEFGREVLQRTEYVLFVHESTRYGSLDDLRGRRIGVRRGFRLPDKLEEGARRGQFVLEEIGDDAANFRKLAAGRLDAVMINLDVGRYVSRELGMTRLRVLLPPLGYLDNHLVFTKGKGHTSLLGAFDKALAAMRQDGSVERIRARYMDR
ncbi:MAG: transporter substrate-binding domain-containing protein [Betaproteobacteria bacterium]|nr:transporter substrate-binding domain-containing protein [Betaproteobacteria bacterium]